MKTAVMMSILVMSISGAFASEEKCEALNNQAVEQSLTDICGGNSQDDLNSCHRDGDFYVLMQEYTYEIMSELISTYNQENPRAKINCDDFDFERNY